MYGRPTVNDMKRRDFIRLVTGAIGGLALGSRSAAAEGVGDQIASQLRRMGYVDISVQRTLLGRLRVFGIRGTRRREIIVNASSGEILRDLTTDSRSAGSILLDDDDGPSGRSGSGNDSGAGSESDSGSDNDGDTGGNSGSGGDSGSDSGGDTGSGGDSGSGGGSDSDSGSDSGSDSDSGNSGKGGSGSDDDN